MRIWIDRNKINQLSAMLNSIELETGRLKKMVGEIQEQVEPTKPEASRSEPKPTPVKVQCSVCQKFYDPAKADFHRTSWIPRTELCDLLDFSEKKEGRALIHICSARCGEAWERKRYMSSFGGIQQKVIGNYKMSGA